MKRVILFIIFIIASFQSKAFTLDSLLFSSDGKYVLKYGGSYLNCCQVEYWKLYQIEKDKLVSYVAMHNDSVFLITYDTLCVGPIFQMITCRTLAKIQYKYKIDEFISIYKLSQKSKEMKYGLDFQIDTLKVYKDAFFLCLDSIKYYETNINFLYLDSLIHSINITTNYLNLKSLEEFKIYFSLDDKYYFLDGLIEFGEYFPNCCQMWGDIEIRKIGPNST